jgi:hypothetical protein
MNQIILAAGEGLHLDTARPASKTGRMNLRQFAKSRRWRAGTGTFNRDRK